MTTLIKEKISVIVPVYNVQKYIEHCIRSICRQTYDNLEIILIDDGSTDDSSWICDQFAEKDSRIKLVHKENEGLVRARKEGLEVSTGRYIAYVDGDDWIEPHMLERLYTILKGENVDIIMCGRYEDTGDVQRKVYHGFPEGRYDQTDMKSEIFPNMIVNQEFFEWGIFPGVWDKLFRRESLEPYQMAVDERLTMGEDAACTYPCILNAKSIFILHECLYHYRQNVESMVKQNVGEPLEQEKFRILYQSVTEQLRKYRRIFDLREQWKEYLLFLMVPRAGYLYRGISELDFLFPFPKVEKGSRILIYGMGTFGQLLYKFLERTEFCRVVATVDRNYVELRKQGLNVDSPNNINYYEFDRIVIANSFAKVREAVYKELISIYSKEKVYMIDEDIIMGKNTMVAFGLEV